MQAWGPVVILSKLKHKFYNEITKELYLLGGRGPLVFELKVTLVRYATAYHSTLPIIFANENFLFRKI